MLAWKLSGNKAVFYNMNIRTGTSWNFWYGMNLGGTSYLMGGASGWPDWYEGAKPVGGFVVPVPKVGPFIGMLVRPELGDDCYAYQDIPNPETFQDRNVELSAWIHTSHVDTTRIAVNDGLSPTYSSYHSGTNVWEQKLITHHVHKDCTLLRIELHLKDNYSPPAFFDSVKMESVSTTYGYDRMNVYEIVEKLVNAVGGTLTYEARSSDIMTIYPVVEVQAGDTALSVLNKVMQLVPDKIKFFGNDAVIYYPRTTDSTVYYYKGPE
jgi:hypothetical protein